MTPVDFDRRDARAGLIAAVSGAILVLLAVMIVGVYWLYTVAYEKTEYEQYTGVSSADLQALRDREDRQLWSYGYVDQAKGIVRLPVTRAMELIANEYKQGKVSYNTKPYVVKPVTPTGAPAGK